MNDYPSGWNYITARAFLDQALLAVNLLWNVKCSTQESGKRHQKYIWGAEKVVMFKKLNSVESSWERAKLALNPSYLGRGEWGCIWKAVLLSCSKNVLQTESLKPNVIVSQFWRPEIWNQDISMSTLSPQPLPSLSLGFWYIKWFFVSRCIPQSSIFGWYSKYLHIIIPLCVPVSVFQVPLFIKPPVILN